MGHLVGTLLQNAFFALLGPCGIIRNRSPKSPILVISMPCRNFEMYKKTLSSELSRNLSNCIGKKGPIKACLQLAVPIMIVHFSVLIKDLVGTVFQRNWRQPFWGLNLVLIRLLLGCMLYTTLKRLLKDLWQIFDCLFCIKKL